MKYPDNTDPNFNKKINEIYKKYKIPSDKKTYNEICKPSSFKLQLPQQFLSNFIDPSTPYRGVLVYHQIGSGKTCTAIQIGEQWKGKKKIFVLLPASLRGNFRTELRSQCGGNNYLKPEEKKILATLHPKDREYIEIIKKSDTRIDRVYNIYSYNSFIKLAQEDRINLNNALLIIDEVQNMVSETGIYYSELYDLIYSAPKNLRIVLLTATPMFDKPQEIALTLNLLKLDRQIPIGTAFEREFLQVTKNGIVVKNLDLFKKMIKGYVSYFKGAPSFVFPEMKIKYVYSPMSNFQYSLYKDVLKNEAKVSKNGLINESNIIFLPNNFYLGSRMVSNVVFPNKKINNKGLDSLTPDIIKNKLEIYSIKFFKIMNKISKTSGKVFIYSSFKEFGGIKSLIKVLEGFGYHNYADKHVEHKNSKVFAVWSSDEKDSFKEEIKTVYNRVDNLYGHKIKILLGSPSIKEGVSLTAVQQVHILEPYWNRARLSQVIGRASRYCSHKDLPADKRSVKVYIYIATHINEIQTVDEYILKLSNNKDKIIKKFERSLQEAAVDCYLNKYSTDANADEKITCDL
jgi:superfamily II DNA or RNA helicase